MKVLTKRVNRPYDIVCTENFNKLKEYITSNCNPSSICIITDTHIAPIYLEEIKSICEQIVPVCSHVFTAGEESKNITAITDIYNTLLTHKIDRSGLIIALGGGVAGDIAGFAASTYMRGIPFIQIPTTIVAQNDSSIGGKVGVDYLEYKNVVGAFHNPLLVYININTLKTLPKRELVGGISEVIKHGLIYNPGLFNYLIDNREDILSLKEDITEEMTYMSAEVKCEVVEQDPKEMGIRKILNFGHTVGHAIETLSHFKYSHGECVAYGICAAAFISYKRKLLSIEILNQVIHLCKSFGLLKSLEDYAASDIWMHMGYDKKKSHGKVSFILLKNIGETLIVTDINEEEISEAINFLKETCN
jgi:3-dehydroquinate synthase